MALPLLNAGCKPALPREVSALGLTVNAFPGDHNQWVTGHKVADRVKDASSRAAVSVIGSWP